MTKILPSLFHRLAAPTLLKIVLELELVLVLEAVDKPQL